MNQRNEEIYRVVKERILFLTYSPGEILNETVLGKEFGVSRTPMREVLMRLAWEKLVRIIPRTGTMVTDLEFQKMMDIFRARFEMEGLAGRMAAENITDHHLEKLAHLIDNCSALLKHSEVEKEKNRLVEIDQKYRDVITAAANNPVVTDVLQHLYEQTFRLWYSTIGSANWKTEIHSVQNELTTAHRIFAKKDPKEAFEMRKSALADHFERIKQRFLGSL